VAPIDKEDVYKEELTISKSTVVMQKVADKRRKMAPDVIVY